MMTLNACHPPYLMYLNDHCLIMSSFFSCSSLHCARFQTCINFERKREVMEKRDRGNSAMAMMGSRDENEDVKSTMRTAETMLRLVPMALCVSALVVMLKNTQTNDFGSLSYSDLGAFRYLVHANGICAGYSLLSAVIVAMPRASTMPRAWTFFLLDQVLTYVTLAAGTVSTEVLYLANKGDTSITWSAACVSFGGFCHKALISIIITFVVVICYAALSLLSSYKLFSKYDGPVVTYPGKGIETATFG